MYSLTSKLPSAVSSPNVAVTVHVPAMGRYSLMLPLSGTVPETVLSPHWAVTVLPALTVTVRV